MLATLITTIVTALLNWLASYANGKIQQHTAKVQQENADEQTKAIAQTKLDAAKTKAEQIAAAQAILKGL